MVAANAKSRFVSPSSLPPRAAPEATPALKVPNHRASIASIKHVGSTHTQASQSSLVVITETIIARGLALAQFGTRTRVVAQL